MKRKNKSKISNESETKPIRKWVDVPAGLECYMRNGVDELDKRAQKLVHDEYTILSENAINVIGNLLHERRWIRDAAAKWCRLQKMHDAKKRKEKANKTNE